jgi:serine/threonine-protein kinase TTK/MPS1
MATASPTPMSNYSHGAGLRIARHYSASRGYVRRDSPPSTANAARQGVATTPAPGPSANSDDDDDLQPPPQLSDLGRSVLEQHDDGVAVAVSASTKRRSTQSIMTAAEHHLPQHRATRSRAAPPPPPPPSQQQHAPVAISSSRSESPTSKTPARATTTPAAPSQRVKRVGLQGAPVRRMKRTPQSEDENNPAASAVAAASMADDDLDGNEPHEFEGDGAYDMVDAPADDAARDQENVQVHDEGLIALKSKVDHYSAAKAVHGVARHHAADRPAPLAPVSSNTPHRPAPPPPPKMSVLEAATKAVGPSATRKKSRRAIVVVNGKTYTQMGRCGKGGSAEVFRVQAENGEMYALKKVRLAGADPAAIAGYKGEIDLLRKLQDTPRVIRLLDYMVDEEKLCLYVVSRRIGL